MKFYFIIILFNIISLTFSSEDYLKSTYLTYKPLKHSSLVNFQIAFYELHPAFGMQWWVSDNLQLSGMMSYDINNSFSLYNNISVGYYNQNLKWIYSSSNFLEISLHKIKYNDKYSRWINYAYKSRYDYKNFILGYDINHCFWKDIKNNFISLIISYNINQKIIFELKSDINSNNIFNSFNCSIPL